MTVADVPGDESELLEVSVLNLDVIGAGQQAEPLLAQASMSTDIRGIGFPLICERLVTRLAPG